MAKLQQREDQPAPTPDVALRPFRILGQPINFDLSRGIILWVAIHVLVAQGAQASEVIATLAAGATMVALVAVAARCRTITTLVCAASYAAMADIFWRMTRAKVPWEGGKYLAGIILLMGLYRFVGKPRNIALPVAYFVLLLPAIPGALFYFSLARARSQISFTLAAPLLLAIGVVFFRQIRCQWDSVRPVLWTMIGPIAAVASLATKATAGLSAAAFSNAQSNDVAAGNFGANQVSDLLGLGLLFVLMLALQDRNWVNRMLALGLGAWFFAQSALTLSRGGLFTAGLAILVAAPNILAHRRLGLRFLVTASIVGLLVVVVIFPRLESYTGGAVGKRAQDTSSTERGNLAGDDIDAFKANPVVGVGVGVTDEMHQEFGKHVAVASHTEQARMLGEHGLFGVLALLALAGIIIQGFLSQTSWFGRAWVLTLSTWTMVAMTHSGTRIAAIPFAFALGALGHRRGSRGARLDLRRTADAPQGHGRLLRRDPVLAAAQAPRSAPLRSRFDLARFPVAQDPLVELFMTAGLAFDGEVRLDPLPGPEPHPPALVGVVDEVAERSGQGSRITGRHQEAGAAVLDDVLGPRHRGGHRRQPGGHRLQERDRAALGVVPGG